MHEIDPGDTTKTIIIGESGQEYENIHVEAPINQGGGTDSLQVPQAQD